jgi:hypothetical protein
MSGPRPLPTTVRLDHLRLIAISGNDHQAFLQGQLTQDVRRLKRGATCIGGWADARGRLLWAGHLVALPQGIGMIAPAVSVISLLARLKLFVLRANVDLTLCETPLTGIIAREHDGELLTAELQPSIQQLAADATRAIFVGPEQELMAACPGLATTGNSDAWQLADVRAGLPFIVPATSCEFVPQMVNLDLLDGVSFSKGCYTGQEIVARMRFLGRVKRRMLHYRCAAAPPTPGTPVHGETGVIGQVVSAARAGDGCELLAVMRLDESAGACCLEPGRTKLTRLPLPYPIPEAPA